MMEINHIEQFNSELDWTRARRAARCHILVCALKNCEAELISFEHVRTRLNLSQKLFRGLQVIKLKRIRGSVARYKDFTSNFLPRSDHLRDRWKRVRTAVIIQGMTPIEVYQVGNDYYVLDGNHRVSVALQEGWMMIEAYVYEYMIPSEKQNSTLEPDPSILN